VFLNVQADDIDVCHLLKLKIKFKLGLDALSY